MKETTTVRQHKRNCLDHMTIYIDIYEYIENENMNENLKKKSNLNLIEVCKLKSK